MGWGGVEWGGVGDGGFWGLCSGHGLSDAARTKIESLLPRPGVLHIDF